VVREQKAGELGQSIRVINAGRFLPFLRRSNGMWRKQVRPRRILIVHRYQKTEDAAYREQESREQELPQIAAKDGRIVPKKITEQSKHIDVRLAVDREVGTRDEIVQITLRRFAANEGLGLIQIRSSATIQATELNRLLIIQRRQTTTFD